MSEKKQIPRNTIIGKNSLLISARGQKELAAQIFNYDLVREVRLDIDNKEIKLLMTYDESYFRVFQTFAKDETEDSNKEAQDKLIKFYNDLLYAAMKLTKEEVENLNNQIEFQKKEASKKAEQKSVELELEEGKKSSNSKPN